MLSQINCCIIRNQLGFALLSISADHPALPTTTSRSPSRSRLSRKHRYFSWILTAREHNKQRPYPKPAARSALLSDRSIRHLSPTPIHAMDGTTTMAIAKTKTGRCVRLFPRDERQIANKQQYRAIEISQGFRSHRRGDRLLRLCLRPSLLALAIDDDRAPPSFDASMQQPGPVHVILYTATCFFSMTMHY